MAAVHILIFGEMVGFKIVPFIATRVNIKFYFHRAMKKKKKKSANQNSPICMKTTDIKLYLNQQIRILSERFVFQLCICLRS